VTKLVSDRELTSPSRQVVSHVDNCAAISELKTTILHHCRIADFLHRHLPGKLGEVYGRLAGNANPLQQPRHKHVSEIWHFSGGTCRNGANHQGSPASTF
jgi:hypothetical protein